MDLSSYLNNGGDDVRLIDPAQTTVIDSTSYSFSTNGYSWARITNGGTWSAEESDTPTKNSSNTPAAGAGDVVINEFVANAATEWVELYNTTLTNLDISGYYIDDIAAGGGTPKAIPADTIIPAGGYYVLSFSGFLNNGGDDVRFLDPTQTTVLDAHTYGSASADSSIYRFPDGGAWAGVEANPPSPGASNPGTGDTPWTPGTFEIRIFDVEQGDSQLIIYPSGFSILIDVREASWNTGAGAAYIAGKIQAITGGTHVNVGVISHHHLDHMGYAGYGGFWGLLENEGITFDKIVDRNAGAWVDGYGGGTVDGVCDPDLEIQWYNAGTQSGTGRNWLCYATNSANLNIFPIREIATLNSTTQIDPPDVGAVVEIVQVDGDSVMLVDGVTPIQGDHTGDAVPPSENDYSIALKVTYGDIDYATAGDADGVYDTSTWGYTYNDVETILAPRFGQVDILRANHHGSGHSTSQYYVDTLNPDASAVSCGNNTYGHPAQEVINRLLATGALYFTNTCDTTVNYGSSVIVNGDIIIKSTDGTNYTVNGDPFVASGGSPTPTPTSPPPTATPTPTPVAQNMHVGDLDGATTPANRGRWNATITITVEDASHNPVAGATVDGNWSNGASGSGSCITDANGTCSITKNNIGKNKSSATFTITNVTEGSYTYTSGSNHDPDGDSTGTVIVVNKP
jgi:beta-lactamase superfamily II metal-dependent hydrolase